MVPNGTPLKRTMPSSRDSASSTRVLRQRASMRSRNVPGLSSVTSASAGAENTVGESAARSGTSSILAQFRAARRLQEPNRRRRLDVDTLGLTPELVQLPDERVLKGAGRVSASPACEPTLRRISHTGLRELPPCKWRRLAVHSSGLAVSRANVNDVFPRQDLRRIVRRTICLHRDCFEIS